MMMWDTDCSFLQNKNTSQGIKVIGMLSTFNNCKHNYSECNKPSTSQLAYTNRMYDVYVFSKWHRSVSVLLIHEVLKPIHVPVLNNNS